VSAGLATIKIMANKYIKQSDILDRPKKIQNVSNQKLIPLADEEI